MMRSLRARRLLFQIGTGVLLFAALELVVRDLVPPPTLDRYRFARLAGADGLAWIGQQRDAGAFLDEAQRLLEPDARLIWRLRPDLDLEASSLSLGARRAWRVHTSPDGFRDRPLAERPEGETRVLAAGDSSTFGWGVEDDETWPAVLEGELGDGWQVLNLAVPGYSALQGRLVVEELAPRLQADVVVAAFGANEGHMVLRTDAETLAGRSTTVGQARYAASQLRLVQLGRAALFPVWAGGMQLGWQAGLARPRVAPAAYEEALEDLARHAPRTILIDVCSRQEYGRVMRELAETRPDVELISYKTVHGETLDGCHPTPAGQAALAGALAALLEKAP